MKHLLSTFHKALRQKITLELLPMLIVGLLGGGSLLFLSPSFAYAASDCMLYTVKSGDTLSYIAATHRSNVEAITQVNHIPNVNLIFPGQRFCIPTSQISTSTGGSGAKGTGTTGQSSVTAMIYQVFGSYAPEAIRVANCESGLNPSAYNPISISGSHAAGVFQILYPSTWMGTPQASQSPYDAMANILAAHAIFVRDGYSWHEWTCSS